MARSRGSSGSCSSFGSEPCGARTIRRKLTPHISPAFQPEDQTELFVPEQWLPALASDDGESEAQSEDQAPCYEEAEEEENLAGTDGSPPTSTGAGSAEETKGLMPLLDHAAAQHGHVQASGSTQRWSRSGPAAPPRTSLSPAATKDEDDLMEPWAHGRGDRLKVPHHKEHDAKKRRSSFGQEQEARQRHGSEDDIQVVLKHREWWNFLYKKSLAFRVASVRRKFQQSWLFTMKHMVLQYASFLVFVVLSANDGIIKARSKRLLDGAGAPRDFPYAFSSVLLVASLLSVLGGSVTAYCLDGYAALCKCWCIRSILNMSPASVLFQFGTVLKFMSLKYLAPDQVSMLSQMNLVMLAVTMRFILGRRYRKAQWTALVMSTLAMLQYVTVRDAHLKGNVTESPMQLSSEAVTGLATIIGMCIAETLASVLAEKQFKERLEPFYVLKVHADFCGLVFAAVWCFVLEPFFLKDLNWSCRPQRCRQVIDQGFLSGWDSDTVLVLALVVTKMWAAGLVARVLDSLVKQLASCCAVVLTFLEVVWIDPDENSVDFETLVVLSLVMCSIAQFAFSTRDSITIDDLRKRHEFDASWTKAYQKPSAV